MSHEGSWRPRGRGPMTQSHHSFPVGGKRLPKSLIGHLRKIISTWLWGACSVDLLGIWWDSHTWTLDLWCRHYMVLKRVLLEDCGLILSLHTRRERNQPLDRDWGTSMPSVPPNRGPLDIISQLGRLPEFLIHHHPMCSIGHLFFLDLCLPYIYTQLRNQFMLLKPHKGHPLIIPTICIGIQSHHLHRRSEPPLA